MNYIHQRLSSKSIYLSVLVCCFLLNGIAYGDDKKQEPVVNTTRASADILQPVVQEVGESYVTMTYPNLFRLAWAFDVYKSDDNAALDTYLKISECNLYKKYYKNEFEWEKIRLATKAYLDKYGKKRDIYFEYVQPLELGRYDEEIQGFPLEKAPDYISLKVLQIADFYSR